jgi:hypothetical protein
MAVHGELKAPWSDQVEFFRNKLALPAEAWDDIRREANDRAFFVAGVQKADLLEDFAGVIDRVLSEGKSIGWFRQQFDRMVQEHGWDYKGERNWRTRVIYQTNVQTSYHAGRYAQLTDPELLSVMPLWVYHHGHPVTPRPEHLSWNGMALPATDPWWQTHYTPNGFGCTCWVSATNARQAERKGYRVLDQAPDEGTYDYVNPKTGEITVLPKGVDYGWDYAPGANTRTPLREFVQRKLVDYPEAITKMLSRDCNRYINAKDQAAEFAAKALEDTSMKEPLWLGFVENFAAIQAETGIDTKGYMMLLPGDTPRHVEKVHGKDGKGQRPATPEDYAKLPLALAEAGKIRPGDPSRNGNATVVTDTAIDGETYHCVWEVLPGKKSRALALTTLVIKT